MANIKSAKKRVRTSNARAERNKSVKSAVKKKKKKVDAAIAAKDKNAAQEALLAATSSVQKACNKGIFHKNTAARKISRLTKAVNAL